MKVILLGYRKVAFPDEKTGEFVEGTSIFYAYPINDKNGSGDEAEKKFIRKGQFSLTDFEPGSSYEMDFNSRGRLVDMRKA